MGQKGKSQFKSRWYTYNYIFGLLFYRERARVLIFVWICFYRERARVLLFIFFLVD